VGDDRASYITSSFLFRSSKKQLFGAIYNKIVDKRTTSGYRWSAKRKLNKYGEYLVQVKNLDITNVTDNKIDPVLFEVSSSLSNLLLTKIQDENFLNTITFKYSDGESIVIFGRKGSGHHIDGIRISKKDLGLVLAKIIIRASFVRSVSIMDNYIDRVIHYPPNVLHAIENRSAYNFYHEGTKQEVLINTRVISETECALEISEGIWGAITLKDLNVFINTFRFGQSKSKTWNKAPPEKLWSLLMGTAPTDIQYKLSIAWLMQNRKQNMVEDRATKLLHDMDNEYPRLRLVQFRNPMNKGLFVRGTTCDWVVVDEKKGMKVGRQNVNTYLVSKKSATTGKQTWKGHALIGPICIDNIHSNSSIGDQLVARALALMNDAQSQKQIYTIKEYVKLATERGDDSDYRLDMNSLNSWTKAKEGAWVAKKQAEKRKVKE